MKYSTIVQLRFIFTLPMICQKDLIIFKRKILNKEEDKNQESIKSNTTPDPGHHMGSDKNTLKKTQHTRRPRGHPFSSRWPQGYKKQTRQCERHIQSTNNKKIHKRSTALEGSARKLKEGFICLRVPTSLLFLMWIKTNGCLICMKDPLFIDVLSPSTCKSRNKKEIKQL